MNIRVEPGKTCAAPYSDSHMDSSNTTNATQSEELHLQQSDLEKQIEALQLLSSDQFPQTINVTAEDRDIWNEFLGFQKKRQHWISWQRDQWKTQHAPHVNALFTNWPVLETPRLQLRLLQEADVPDSFRIFSNPTAMKYFGSKLHPDAEYTRDQWVNIMISRFKLRNAAPFAIILKEDGRFVGLLNVGQFNPDFHFAEMAYIVDPEYWGEGVGTEAVRRVVDFLVRDMKLHKIRASVFAKNVASKRVLEKVGFKQEGYLRDNVLLDGVYVDECLMAFISSEN